MLTMKGERYSSNKEERWRWCLGVSECVSEGGSEGVSEGNLIKLLKQQHKCSLGSKDNGACGALFESSRLTRNNNVHL